MATSAGLLARDTMMSTGPTQEVLEDLNQTTEKEMSFV